MKLKAVLMETPNIISRFRGTLLGSLVGDCCGAPFEFEVLESGDKITLRKYFDKLEGPMFKAPFKKYTDDTAMIKCVAKCLIDHKDLPPKELAGSFMREYYNDPNRGYGSGVINVFEKLRKSKLSDPLKPAKEQFNGNGSYGNGAAMRVAPVALFCHNKKDKLVEMVKKSSIVTHTNKLGIDGAILQALALHMCLTSELNGFNQNTFIDDLIEEFKEIEKDEEGLGFKIQTPYQNQLDEIKRFLNSNPSEDEILNVLGHNVSALHSVPTALYCFLKAQHDIDGIQTNNPFRRTIEYAISLGGDTDTIASMAGSLAGALYGETIISENLLKHCEGSDEIRQLADELYNASL